MSGWNRAYKKKFFYAFALYLILEVITVIAALTDHLALATFFGIMWVLWGAPTGFLFVYRYQNWER